MSQIAYGAILHCTHDSPLGRCIAKLKPSGFEPLHITKPEGTWVCVPFDECDRADIHHSFTADVPSITYHAWYDPLGGELWIPQSWCEEVAHD